MKAYGLEVRAPTGQMSMTFPDISDMNIFSTYVPTCMLFPLPVVPRSSTPAISLAKLALGEKKLSNQLVNTTPWPAISQAKLAFGHKGLALECIQSGDRSTVAEKDTPSREREEYSG